MFTFTLVVACLFLALCLTALTTSWPHKKIPSCFTWYSREGRVFDLDQEQYLHVLTRYGKPRSLDMASLLGFGGLMRTMLGFGIFMRTIMSSNSGFKFFATELAPNRGC